MRAIKENAWGKINLYLDVTDKRPDGYHSIRSIMHAIDLSDVITVSTADARSTDIRLFVSGADILPTGNKNLAYRAAELYLFRAGITAKIRINIEKRIPVSAGLAGGSTDAAATLRALNRLYGHFTDRALIELSSELGSDVPFCLVGGTALCEGRGEIITRLPEPKKGYFVIAISDEHVSTPWAYGALDSLYSNFDGTKPTSSKDELIRQSESIEKGVIDPSALYNVFEEAILPDFSGAREIKARLAALGADAALMSGSGPSVFGLFTSAEKAALAKEALEAEGIRAYTAISV